MFILFGLLFGLTQFLLLKATVTFILAGNKIFIATVIFKLCLYATAVSVMWFCFSDLFIKAGIGLGVGMIAGAFFNFFYTQFIKPKGDDKT